MSHEAFTETEIRSYLLEVERVNRTLKSATDLAIESAFRFGLDLPVGAVACCGPFESGRWFASDQRHTLLGVQNWKSKANHAEFMALGMSKLQPHGPVDLLGVNIEPCAVCLESAVLEKVKTVAFVISRTELEARGLVNRRPDIFQLVEEHGYDITVIQYDDPVLRAANLTLLDNTTRDLRTGKVTINTEDLSKALQHINESQV